MSDEHDADGVTKRQLLKGASGALAATAGVSTLGAAGAVDTGGSFTNVDIGSVTVLSEVDAHASAIIDRLVTDGLLIPDAFSEGALQPTDLGTALATRTDAAAIKTPEAPGASEWLVLPRTTADGDEVLVSVDREHGRGFAVVSTGEATTTYAQFDDGVVVADTTAAAECFTICTDTVCFDAGYGMKFESTEIGGVPVCTPGFSGCFCY